MPKLTQELVQERISTNSNGRFTLASTYQCDATMLLLHCNVHNIDFQVSKNSALRTPMRCNCPECSKDLKTERFRANRTEVTCAYCGKIFQKQNSKLNNSKSGLYFCCREHKDLAQRLTSGEVFDNMRPAHYNTKTGTKNYRMHAFEAYPHKCAICGWDEDEDILQVHHIDENRQNSDIDNLIILCPICHWKITTHKYQLINRTELILNNN